MTARSSTRQVRTPRLWLDLPVAADAERLLAIHADPASWVHLPSGAMTDPDGGRLMVAESARQFARDGLGYWSVRDVADGPVIGRGGCAVPEGRPWWNLYYRLAGAAVGRGYATELARAALANAREVEPDRPVLAYLLEHNVGSRRTAEKAGLDLVWRGPDEGNPDPEAVRLVYLDWEPDGGLVDAMARAGMAPEHLI